MSRCLLKAVIYWWQGDYAAQSIRVTHYYKSIRILLFKLEDNFTQNYKIGVEQRDYQCLMFQLKHVCIHLCTHSHACTHMHADVCTCTCAHACAHRQAEKKQVNS